MKTLILILDLLVSGIAFSQKLPVEILSLSGGYSRHSSGDYNGIIYTTEYTRYSSKKFSFSFFAGTTINNGRDEYIINNLITGTRTDASVRYTVAGVQAGVKAGLGVSRNIKHEFKFCPGIYLRYQSSSNGDDGYSLYMPGVTGQPTLLIGYDNRTPQKTFSAGGLLELHYNYTIKNKLAIGISPGFQSDTRGDLLLTGQLSIARRF